MVLSACGGSVTDASTADASVESGGADATVPEAEPYESSIPDESGVVGDTGRDLVTEPTPAGCDKVPTVPAYKGGAACTTAVANSCDCRPMADLAKGPMIALAGITPKGEAVVQFLSGTTWSCPVAIAGGPWVQIEWFNKRVVLRDDKGALFYSDLASSPLAMGPAKAIDGASTTIRFESGVGLAYARSSDGLIERRASEPGGFAAPVATPASTKLAFSFASGSLVYAHADGFVHLLGLGAEAKDQKTTVPNGVTVADLFNDSYGAVSFSRHTIISIDAAGRIQTDWSTGCPAELCFAQFAEWTTYVSGSFLRSTLEWTRDGRSFMFTPSYADSKPEERVIAAPILFRTTPGDRMELYALASDCSLRFHEWGRTATGMSWDSATVVPRTVLASPPSLARLTF